MVINTSLTVLEKHPEILALKKCKNVLGSLKVKILELLNKANISLSSMAMYVLPV
jgi:hypothetical protein